jgi:hypothetical protein
MPAKRVKKYKAIVINTPANGRSSKSRVFALGEGENVLFTDSGNLSSAVEREKVAGRIAKHFKLKKAIALKDLEEAWNDTAGQYAVLRQEPGTAVAGGASSDGRAGEANPLVGTPEDILQEAEALLKDPELMMRVAQDVEACGVAGEQDLTTTIYLTGVSRLLPRPLACRVKGPSSSGKSYIIDTTVQLLPPEAVIVATQMTAQALFHMPEGRLSHKFVVAGERSRLEDDERAEATRALREMLSGGRLSKLMPLKTHGGTIETVRIEQEGPIAFIESTTLERVFDEDENRCLELYTDERSEQTGKVIAQTAAAYQDPAWKAGMDRRVQVHHALQRLLRPYGVRVPYAERLGGLFPRERVEARRAFSHVLNLIQACALLHQRQREVDNEGFLIAAPEDYQLARRLLAKPLSRLLGDAVSDAARRFYLTLAATWPYRAGISPPCFTTTEAKKVQKSSKSAVNEWLWELESVRAVQLVEEGRGRKPAVWQLTDLPPAEGGTLLPSVYDITGGDAIQEHKL